jgi:DinB family protein
MADTLAADLIFTLTTLNDELIGSLDWVPEEAWSKRSGPDAWSAAEIIGHVIELEPYWARQAALLAERPGSAVGRGLEDPERLAGPAQGISTPPKEARTRIAQAGEETAEILRKIPDSAFAVTGTWRDAPISLAELLQRHLVDHVRDHLEQVTEALSVA